MPDRPMAVVKMLIQDLVDGQEPGAVHAGRGVGVAVGRCGTDVAVGTTIGDDTVPGGTAPVGVAPGVAPCEVGVWAWPAGVSSENIPIGVGVAWALPMGDDAC